MSTEKNVQIVKNFLAAVGRRDKQDLLALSAEDIEWIIPGEDWPLAGTHRGHAGLENLLQKANETVETSFPEPPNSWRRETEFWSSASLQGKSKPRIGRSRTTGSSPSPFEMAK
jgi:ketosteroid isomerase-like protein